MCSSPDPILLTDTLLDSPEFLHRIVLQPGKRILQYPVHKQREGVHIHVSQWLPVVEAAAQSLCRLNDSMRLLLSNTDKVQRLTEDAEPLSLMLTNNCSQLAHGRIEANT